MVPEERAGRSTDPGWSDRQVLVLMQKQIDDNKSSNAQTITALVKSLDERALSDRTAIAAALAAQEKAVAAADETREKQTIKSELAADTRHNTLVEKMDEEAKRSAAALALMTSRLDQGAGRWLGASAAAATLASAVTFILTRLTG